MVVELREILDSGDFAAHILARAKKLVSLRPSRETVVWSPPTLSGLEKRLGARLKEGRGVLVPREVCWKRCTRSKRE